MYVCKQMTYLHSHWGPVGSYVDRRRSVAGESKRNWTKTVRNTHAHAYTWAFVDTYERTHNCHWTYGRLQLVAAEWWIFSRQPTTKTTTQPWLGRYT